MTYVEMVTMVRQMIDDVNSVRFSTDEPIRLFLNMAYKQLYREIIRRTVYTDAQTTTITFTSGNQNIAFDAGVFDNIQKVLHVEDANQIPIPIYPEEYSRRGIERSIYLRRVLVTAGDSKTEKLWCGWYVEPTSTFPVTILYQPKVAEFPSGVADAEQLDLVPVEHHDIVVLRAVVLALSVDEEQQSIMYSLYQESLKSMLETIGVENEATDHVVDVNSEGSYAAYRS